MPHQLNIKDLQTFSTSTVIAGSFGNGKNKKIVVESMLDAKGNIKSFFSVYNQNICVQSGSSLAEAIENYNKY
jgi:hypothetical protein